MFRRGNLPEAPRKLFLANGTAGVRCISLFVLAGKNRVPVQFLPAVQPSSGQGSGGGSPLFPAWPGRQRNRLQDVADTMVDQRCCTPPIKHGSGAASGQQQHVSGIEAMGIVPAV